MHGSDGSEWDMEIWRPEVENVTWGCSSSVIFSTEGRHNFHVPRTTVCRMFCRMANCNNRIISGLQWRNVNEYCLPSENAHSPSYCSWLAVCFNYSANYYCKIALINRFKLYLIKTYSTTSKKNKKKQTKCKQKQRRICLTFAFSERHMTSHHVTL